jgi:M6 family metalloprotease-like protein
MHVVLDYWESQGVDMAQYDQDGDGVIDVLIMLHSGYPAEVSGVDCQTQASELNRIWSHAIGHSTAYSWKSSTTGIQSGPYMIGSAMRGTCGSNLNHIGVLTHEFMHIWGIPDLYDTSGDWIGKGVGSYDIMGNPYGLAGDQTLPSNIGPWTKLQMQWIEPTVIEADGYYTIEPSATSPQIYKISAGFPSPDEYLLIENRQPILWDASFTGGGLVIWHIDDAAPGQQRRGYPSQTGWPSNGNHYQVAVLQADGRYDLEQGVNQGDADDFYSYGNELGPAPIEYGTVTQSLYPCSNSYFNGQPMQTGIRIYDISPSGTVMSFRVSGISPATAPSSPSPAVSSTPVSTPTPVSSTQVPTSPILDFPTLEQTPPPTSVPVYGQEPAPTPPPTSVPVYGQEPSPTPPPTSVPVYGQEPSPTPPPVVFQTQIPVETPVDIPTESTTLGPTTDEAITALPTTAAPFLTTTSAPAATGTTSPTVSSQTTLPASPMPTASPLPLENVNILTLSSAYRLKRTALLTIIALIVII